MGDDMSEIEKRREWTPEELQALATYYGTMPNLELQKRHLPGRNVRAIELKAMRTGLSRRISERKWTEAELDALKKFGTRLYDDELREKWLNGRTKNAVYMKLAELKSGNPRSKGRNGKTRAAEHKPWTDDELAVLKRYYRVMSVPAIHAAYLPDRSLHAIENMARVTVPPKTKRWLASEIAVLRRYYGTMPVRELVETKLPNRTVSQASTMAHTLGLTRPQKKKRA